MTGNWLASASLTGQVAVVTGGGTGIGRACAETLAAAGAKVVVAARRLEPLQEVVSAIKSNGGEALAVSADVTTQADIDKVVTETVKAFRRIDILVSNSGMSIPRCHIFDVTKEDWERLMALNMTAGFFVAQACGREMAKVGGGRIVFMTSQRGISGLPGIVPYCTSKGAIMSMTKALAVDLAPQNITVNAVAPGYVMTDMVAGLLADKERLQAVYDRTPLRKMGTVDEIAAAVLYFVQPEATYTTGQSLILDGGWSVY